MAGYSIRTLVELSAQAKGFLTQSIEGAVASVWANTFRVFGKVLALVGFELELRRAWLFRQMFASTADRDWLVRHGFELGLQPFPAVRALGSVTLPAPAGLVVPAGLRFARGDGATFATLAGETAAGGTVRLTIQADVAGALGNTEAGEPLILADEGDAPEGLGLEGAVAAAADGSGLTGGADAEDTEAFRARVLARRRRPPQGGGAGDYETWVREALGEAVEAVYVDSFQDDARAVWVAFTVADRPNGIPSTTQLAVAQAYLDDPVRRPVTARVYAVALTPAPVPLLIGGLAPDTPDIRAAIAAEVEAAFADRARPGTPSTTFALSRSWLEEAISRATGEDRHRLIAPPADLAFAAGFLPVPGGVAYTD